MHLNLIPTYAVMALSLGSTVLGQSYDYEDGLARRDAYAYADASDGDLYARGFDDEDAYLNRRDLYAREFDNEDAYLSKRDLSARDLDARDLDLDRREEYLERREDDLVSRELYLEHLERRAGEGDNTGGSSQPPSSDGAPNGGQGQADAIGGSGGVNSVRTNAGRLVASAVGEGRESAKRKKALWKKLKAHARETAKATIASRKSYVNSGADVDNPSQRQQPAPPPQNRR